MATTVKTLKAIFRKSATRPKYTSAQILTGPDAERVELILGSSVSDLDQDVKRNFSTYKSFRTSVDGNIADSTEWVVEEKDDVVKSVPHEYIEGQRIVFRAFEDKKGGEKKKYFVERWSRSAMIDSINVSAYHNDFYTEDIFGSFAFHPSIASRIAYIAEWKKPEDETYKKFEYVDDWGEMYGKKETPVVVVLDFEAGLEAKSPPPEAKPPSQADEDKRKETEGKIIVMDPPDGLACGQVVFPVGSDAEQRKVVWVGTRTTPKRYGIIWMTNRSFQVAKLVGVVSANHPAGRSNIFESDYDGSYCRNLTKDYEHVRSPRFGKDGSLYFLTNPASGVHFQCSAVHRLHPPTGKTSVIVPIVQESKPGEFAGIFALRMNQIHSDTMVVTTFVHSTNRTYAFRLHPDGSQSEARDLVTDGTHEDSWSVIGYNKGQVVLMRQELSGEVELRHLRLADGRSLRIHSVAPSPDSSNITRRIITYPGRPFLEAILCLPQKATDTLFSNDSSSKPPVMLFPHGGPHAADSTGAFSDLSAGLLQAGIALLFINFTGSAGFGQASIEALVGKGGVLDVEEVQHARDELAESGLIDSTRIGIMGGSYGGYLTGWMIAKHPSSYRVSILMNPALNIGLFPAESDIPDFSWGENGLPYNLDTPPLPTPATYQKLWEVSPMSAAAAVKTPSLLLLGAKDRRVPTRQGLDWMAYLKGKGDVDVRCFMYPDASHGLAGVTTEKFLFEAAGVFLKEFL